MPHSRPLLTISFLVCLLGILFLLTRSSTQVALPPAPPIIHHRPSSKTTDAHKDDDDEAFSLASFYTIVPYTSKWTSWWHPNGDQSVGGKTTYKKNKKKKKIIIDKDWNLLYHLGGNGPWIEKVDGVVDGASGGLAPPEGCRVEQVHMMSRHAERYPTANAGGRMLQLEKRIRESGVELKGDLKFVKNWEYFTDTPEKHHEQLTTTGPYAGTLEAFTTGVKLRTRYGHLIKESPTTAGGNETHLWASDSSRVIATARYFSAGLFGLDWADKDKPAAILHVIPETDNLGADTLTPGDTCLRYRDDLDYGHDYGLSMLLKFRGTYLGAVGERLYKQNPGIRFTDQEIYSMQEMCGFETLVRGESDWCHVFTRQDWENFEYARDVVHYYRSGPGNRYGPAMGWLWLNATANLIAAGPSAGPLFFSFVHDGDIIPMISALQLFPSSQHLSVTHLDRKRTWRTSQLTPMGGRVIFERLSCSSTSTGDRNDHHGETKQHRNIYVRINVNDGIVALPGCDSGPGKSCPLDEFLELVSKRGEEAGDFRQVCGLGPDAADRITFLHQ